MGNTNDQDRRYRVTIVEETTAPEGMTGDNWCRYVIELGDSRIDCKKTGSHWAITQHANDVANRMNERYTRGGVTFVSRNRK